MIQEQIEAFSPHIARLHARAFAHPMRIVLTDGADERALAATRTLVKESAIQRILVGQAASILPQLEHMGISGKVDVYDPSEDPRQHDLVYLLRAQLEKRGKAIPDQSTLYTMASEPIYSGMLLVQAGLADGLVGGRRAQPLRCFVRAFRSWVLIHNAPWFLAPSLCCLPNGFPLVRMPSFLGMLPLFPIRAPNSWHQSLSIQPMWHRQCLGKNRSSPYFRSPPMAVPKMHQ